MTDIYNHCQELAKQSVYYFPHSPEKCLALLRQAESLLKTCSKLERPFGKVLQIYACTLNNIGCVYKTIGKPLSALKYLQNVLEVEQKCNAS